MLRWMEMAIFFQKKAVRKSKEVMWMCGAPWPTHYVEEEMRESTSLPLSPISILKFHMPPHMSIGLFCHRESSQKSIVNAAFLVDASKILFIIDLSRAVWWKVDPRSPPRTMCLLFYKWTAPESCPLGYDCKKGLGERWTESDSASYLFDAPSYVSFALRLSLRFPDQTRVPRPPLGVPNRQAINLHESYGGTLGPILTGRRQLRGRASNFLTIGTQDGTVSVCWGNW